MHKLKCVSKNLSSERFRFQVKCCVKSILLIENYMQFLLRRDGSTIVSILLKCWRNVDSMLMKNCSKVDSMLPKNWFSVAKMLIQCFDHCCSNVDFVLTSNESMFHQYCSNVQVVLIENCANTESTLLRCWFSASITIAEMMNLCWW